MSNKVFLINFALINSILFILAISLNLFISSLKVQSSLIFWKIWLLTFGFTNWVFLIWTWNRYSLAIKLGQVRDSWVSLSENPIILKRSIADMLTSPCWLICQLYIYGLSHYIKSADYRSIWMGIIIYVRADFKNW